MSALSQVARRLAATAGQAWVANSPGLQQGAAGSIARGLATSTPSWASGGVPGATVPPFDGRTGGQDVPHVPPIPGVGDQRLEQKMAQTAMWPAGEVDNTTGARLDQAATNIAMGTKEAASKLAHSAQDMKERAGSTAFEKLCNAEDAVDRGMERASHAVKDAGATVMDKAHNVRESAEATVDSVKHRAEDVLNAAARGAESLVEKSKEAMNFSKAFVHNEQEKGRADGGDVMQRVVQNPEFETDEKRQVNAATLGTRSDTGSSF